MSWPRIKLVLVWVLTLLLAALFFRASARKFLGVPETVGHFVAWGYPYWFLLTVAAIELSGALLLLVPKTAPAGAGLLCVIMAGAEYTHLAHQQYANAVTPAVAFVFLVGIAWHRWGHSLPRAWVGAQRRAAQ